MKLEIAAVAAVCVVGAATAWLVFDGMRDRPTTEVSKLAMVAPAVKGQPRRPVAIKAPVLAYEGSTKANLRLPDEVQADPHQQVIAASQVRGDLRPQTVSTVVNTETGEVKTYVKRDDYPWLAWEPRGEARLMYGVKFDPTIHAPRTVARLQVSYDAVRVKALTVGVTGTLDSDLQAFVGVGVSYRW